MKLLRKVKTSSKEIKKYDAPLSPYRRLLDSPELRPEAKDNLTRLCLLYNPIILQHVVNVAALKLREAIESRSLARLPQNDAN
jgi:hypothetical protein